MEFFDEFKSSGSSSSNSEANQNGNVSNSELSKIIPPKREGYLLITGSNDWDAVLSNITTGWEEYHLIAGLPATVSATFSSSASMHLFILLSDGSLYAMGKNDHGQLGTGDTNSYHSPVPITYKFPGEVVKVATGKAHTLVLLSNGKVFACGSHAVGQLGLGDNKSIIMKDQVRFLEIIALENIVDISCGESFSLVCNADGRMYTFGHPENGVLGLGSTGGFIKEGKSGIQFSYVYRPTMIPNFVFKDSHNKVVEMVPADQIKIRLVSAGKAHCLAVEEWENNVTNGTEEDIEYESLRNKNRVFSWGFGGYGRLGHNGAHDELIPREVSFFTQVITSRQPRPNTQKMVRSIQACSTFSLAVTETKSLHFWGKLARSPEATMYPKPVQDLIGLKVTDCSGGSNCVFITADNDEGCVGWGVPVSGKFGFEGGGKSSAQPKYVSDVNPYHPLSVSCGYGHVAVLVEKSDSNEEKLKSLPVVMTTATTGSGSSSSSSAASGGGESKKRASAGEKKVPAVKKAKTATKAKR